MHQSDYLVDILIFLVAAVIIVPVFQRLRSSPILGYLAAGLLIGPHGLGFVENNDAVHHLAEFGVVFLLFMIGLELSFRRLRSLGKRIFGLGSAQVLVTGALIGGVALYLGYTLTAAIIIGGGLALSSTAFVLQLLDEKGERASRFGLASFSILLLQDLAVVPLMIFVTLSGSPEASFLESLINAGLKGGAAFLAVVVIGRFLLRPLFDAIATLRSPELFVAATLLTILGLGWMMKLAGLSMELGALLAGLLLAETAYRHQIKADIRPFRGLLLGLFFITIGMSIDLGLIYQNLGLVTLLVGTLMLGKAAITTLLCRLAQIPLPVALRTGLTLAQGGEFGFVLFGAALGLGLLPDQTGQILMAVIALSMGVTPFVYILGRRLACRLEQDNSAQGDRFDAEVSDISNHMLIAGFGRVGQTVARVVSETGQPFVALDLDQKRIQTCRRKGLPVFFGDAAQLPVLEAAGAARARLAVITLDQHEEASRVVEALHSAYPELPIYVRARDRQHMRDLLDVGASRVVAETAESSLQLGGLILEQLDVSQDEIASVLQRYREDEYRLLNEVVPPKAGQS